ncbi:MAG: FliI/YscN family ATPase [Vampirovibrionales bacterium]|nr:FliI/YscN family ATPase [Vampirovibrionales bacterium]
MSLLSEAANTLQTAQGAAGFGLEALGQITRVVGLMLESNGPAHAKLGDVCEIETGEAAGLTEHMPANNSGSKSLAEVVGFKDDHLLLMPLGELPAVKPGTHVRCAGKPFKIPVGPELAGRVLDGLGQPIDGRFPLNQAQKNSVTALPPHPLNRLDVTEPFFSGVRAIDTMLTLGKGQRVGIFSGSGVGKSTTLGMMARNSEADINVIALIGERGREVREFIDQCLGPEGLKRSVLIVATSEQPALLKIKAALVATTIAEYYRDMGKNVLLMMDSLTRVAMALREVGLATGEPPAMRGYTPSMFAFMPKLVERAGMAEVGSITGLYTVLVEGDDMNEPVADTVRGLLDGHIVLSRELADQNHFPAIDVPASISRVMHLLVSPEQRQQAGQVRNWIATYRKSEDLINIGAYAPGSNPMLDKAVQMQPRINAFLRQQVHEHSAADEALAALATLAQTS